MRYTLPRLLKRTQLYLVVWQAVTVYEQLQLEEDTGPSTAADTVARGDDIGRRFDDQVGLATRVRERCRQQSDIVRLAMHRETIYQGMPQQATVICSVTSVCVKLHLHHGITDSLFRRLQSVQNAAARLITGIHGDGIIITPVLRDLYWLPVRLRVDYIISYIIS